MGRTVNRFHIVIVRGMLVFVPDDETYRRAGCLSLVDAGKKLYLIILFTGGRDTGLSRFTTVQLLLDECRI